jgi:two-component system, OmpR family, sensor histidine kinase QseC
LIAELASDESGISKSYPAPDYLLFQWFDHHGRLLGKSNQAPATALTDLKQGFSTISHDGYRWRTYTLMSASLSGNTIIAERLDNRYRLTEAIILKTIIPILIGLPFLAVLIGLIVTQGLKPLERLSAEVATKRSQDLTPIQQDNLPDELHPLLESMNGLLSRLSSSFEREKRFSSDAAHELRTPLSTLKINLFNLKKRLPKQDSDVQAMDESLSRMVHLIEQMLLLYRISPESFQNGFKELDAFELVQQVIADNYPAIAAKQQEVSLEGENIMLVGDEFALKILVKNLLDNANKYTPVAGEIAAHMHRDENDLLLTIEDSGIGIPDELMARALERFYRVYGDQNASKIQGCGLGLSIVKHIADLHQGSISLKHSSFDTGLKVEVRLPLLHSKNRQGGS